MPLDKFEMWMSRTAGGKHVVVTKPANSNKPDNSCWSNALLVWLFVDSIVIFTEANRLLLFKKYYDARTALFSAIFCQGISKGWLNSVYLFSAIGFSSAVLDEHTSGYYTTLQICYSFPNLSKFGGCPLSCQYISTRWTTHTIKMLCLIKTSRLMIFQPIVSI